jgi:energy-converting hydrogenase B subunit E
MAYVHITILLTAVALIIIGLYSAIFIDNIIKKIIGISFIEEGANLFIVAIGYRPDGVVPILVPGMDPSWFAANAAYPLPFGLVLTSIVIGASTLAVMLALVMVLYRKYGTLSTKVMLADTSKQEEYNE